MAAELGRAVAGELDEVERVRDRDRAREVGDERDARLERADEQRLAAGVVARDLGAELPHAGRDLARVEVDLADALVEAPRAVTRPCAGRTGSDAREVALVEELDPHVRVQLRAACAACGSCG